MAESNYVFTQKFIKKDGTIAEYSTTRTYTKKLPQITEEMREQILNDYVNKVTTTQMSKKYGISVGRIRNVIKDARTNGELDYYIL